MKEIKLWEISTDEKGEPSAHLLNGINQTETEDQLENLLVRCPDLLFDDLKLVGRQTETAGGPLDLLGVDADGRLVIFELKRGTLTREAVAQIIDYASYLSEFESDDLSKHISERSGHLGIEKIDDFLAWYQEQFAESLSKSLKPRMVLVGLGADDRTRRMVSFLADSDIDISLITFYGFEEKGKTYLAKQIEVESKEPTAKATKKDNLAKLQQKADSLQVGDFYFKMAAFFREHLSAYEWPNPGGYAYAFSEITDTGSESYRVYISLYIYDYHPGKVEIRIHPRGVKAASEAYESFEQNIADRIKKRSDGGGEVWIGSSKEWEDVEVHFEKLCPAINKGWQDKREQRVVEEQQAASQPSTEVQADE